MYDIASIIFLGFRRVWAGKRRLRKGILRQAPGRHTTFLFTIHPTKYVDFCNLTLAIIPITAGVMRQPCLQ